MAKNSGKAVAVVGRPAVIEGEATTVDEGRIKAQEALAHALKRRPGLEADLGPVLEYVGLPEPVAETSEVEA